APVLQTPKATSSTLYFDSLTVNAGNGGFLHCIQMDTSVNAANQVVSVGADIAFDADPKFFACLVRFESSSVPTTLPTAYDVYLNILHRNFTRRQVAIQNRVASNIGISQSTFSVKVLSLFSRSRRKTNKRKSKHSAMLRNKETRHRMFIGLLNTTRKLARNAETDLVCRLLLEKKNINN